MKKHLIWFRKDLRLIDNLAVHFACINPKSIVYAIFIATPKQWKVHNLSKFQANFIYKNLLSLKYTCNKLNIPLYYKECTDFFSAQIYLIHFCKKKKITSVFYNFEYEYNELKRDILINKKLKQLNISVFNFHDSMIINPNAIKTTNFKFYKKYFFFKKTFLKIMKDRTPFFFPAPKIRLNKKKYNFIKEKNIIFSYKRKFINPVFFPVGENNAFKKFTFFLTKKINFYKINKDYPYLNLTSLLSPYFSLGVLSLRKCFYMLYKKNHFLNNSNNNCIIWMNELIWREFYKYLFFAYKKLSKNVSFSPWEKKIKWKNKAEFFKKWKKGKTGYPIIDAAMRQLKQEGWINNRLRMITASFLVKNLHIDWRKGEKYFMSKLIDGDYSSNNGNWQWIASVGTDVPNFIRVFNPILQSKKIDKDALFIRKFLPELKHVPNKHIHEPWKWNQFRKKIKKKYPQPLVNFQDTKKKFFKILKDKK